MIKAIAVICIDSCYPEIFYSYGEVLTSYSNKPSSYIYEVLLHKCGIEREYIDNLSVYESLIFETYLRLENRSGSKIINASDLSETDQHLYSEIKVCGYNLNFQTAELRQEQNKLHDSVESTYFPYRLEFKEMKKLLFDMESRLGEISCNNYESLF